MMKHERFFPPAMRLHGQSPRREWNALTAQLVSACLSIGALGGGTVVADPPPECPPPDTAITYPVEDVPADCVTPTFRSRCWRKDVGWEDCASGGGLVVLPHESLGYPLNLSLRWGVTPGDFPPRSLDPIRASAPLLPAARGAGWFGPASFAERPILADALDLITGAPLIQHVDFELPFGGATFRHVRTYSVHPHEFRPWSGCPPTPDAALWDWQGIGWMMGEAPILLVDAAYADIVGESPRRCYLIGDAHHAVPFELVPQGQEQGEAQYIAPSHFDARMSHNGAGWEDENPDEWATPPTEFTIWLHGGSVRYFFKTWDDVHLIDGRRQYSDIPDVPNDGQPGSDHLRPNPGAPQDPARPHGTPRYALLDRIEDQNGNVVKLFYCEFQQTAEDDPSPGSPCAECLQNCTEKGQLKGIKLYAADDLETAVWTLLYTYRSFWSAPYVQGQSPPNLEWWDQLGREEFVRRAQNAVHSIHVYDGDRELPAACTVLGTRHFIQAYANGVWGPGFTSLNQIDALDTLSLVDLPAGGNYSDWLYEAKYFYSERATNLHPDQGVRDYFGYGQSGPTIFDAARHSRGGGMGGDHPTLLKATVTRRRSSGQSVATSSDVTVYRYVNRADSGSGRRELQAVYMPETVRSILSAEFSQSDIPTDAGVNALLYLTDDTLVTTTDPNTSSTQEKPFGELADVRFDYPGLNKSQFVRSQACADMLGFINEGGAAGGAMLYVRNPQTSTFASRLDGGAFRVWQILRVKSEGTLAPDEYMLDSMPSLNNPIRSMLHHPYRWWGMIDGDADGEAALPLDETTWVTVLDRFPTLEAARAADPSAGYEPTGRRVIKMNAAGHVLSDREWTFSEDGSGQLVSSMGTSEELELDPAHGYRVKARRTIGFTSPHNPDPANEGLVYKYYYGDETETGSASRYIEEVRVKRGADEEVDNEIRVVRTERNEDWPELVTKEVVYDEGDVQRETTTVYDLEQVDSPLPGRRGTMRIRSKKMFAPAAPVTPGGSARTPVMTEHYDDCGRLLWVGRGLVANVSSFPAAGDLFYLNYAEYDERGWVQFEIADAVPGTTPTAPRGSDPNHPYEVPVHPEGYTRQPEDGALEHITAYGYHEYFGLTETYYPNGRANIVRYTQLDVDEFVQRNYAHVVFPSTGSYIALGGGSSVHINGGRTEFIRAFLQVSGQGFPSGQEPITTHTTVTPQYDSAGRLTGVGVDGSGGDTVGAAVALNDLGQVARELAPDGTITRTVRDRLGRTTGVYRGTNDLNTYWGYPPQPPPQGDNLTLIEKRFYGEGVHDAGRLTKVVSYRDKPLDQYTPDTNEDQIGSERLYRYDWRMREVWVEERTARTSADPDGEAIRHTVTWLDNQDRPRLVAVFATAITGGIGSTPALDADVDPTQMTSLPAPSGMPALVSEILAAGPVSLSETIYNARGLVEEQRSYDTDSTDPSNYLVTRTFYDHEDRPVWTSQPGGGVRTSVHDAKGRQVESSLWAAGLEVTRTRTEFDADGNALVVETAERTHNGTGTQLGAANSVTTYTFQWYDEGSRLIASAECGTAHGSDTFTAATPATGPPDRPEQPPTWDPQTLSYNTTGLGPAHQHRLRAQLGRFGGPRGGPAVRPPPRDG